MIWLLLICSLFLYWFLYYLKFEWHLRKFPGPTPIPFIGAALELNTTKKALMTLYKYQKKYKGNFRIYVGLEPMIAVSEPKVLEYFLASNQHIEKAKQYKFLWKWLGQGLLVSRGQYWRRHRKIITPAFHFKILEEYVKVFDAMGDILIDKLKSDVGNVIDIYLPIGLCALDVMCESAMGTTIKAQQNADSKYVNSVKTMGKIILERMFSPIQMTDTLYQFTENYNKEEEALKVIHEYTKSVIKRRQEEIRENGFSKPAEDGSKKQAFLDLLLSYSANGQQLTDEEIREEVDTFLFEGHDTTAAAITFILYELSRNKRVQDKIDEELQTIFSDDQNRSTTSEDLQNMKYLDLVVKEGLRMYPAVPIYARSLAESVTIEGKTYPKGATILIFSFAVQRDEKYFPNPDRFYPERFAPDNTTVRLGGSFAYVPFSAGARNCIGQKFAVLEMKSMLSKVLRHYELKPCPFKHELDLAHETVLRSLSGYPILLANRT